MKNEPVMTLVVALIAAGGGLLAAFGVDVTGEQIGAISAFAVAAIGLGVWVRSKVTPTGKQDVSRLGDERGLTEPLTLLIYVVILIVVVIFLFELLGRVS